MAESLITMQAPAGRTPRQQLRRETALSAHPPDGAFRSVFLVWHAEGVGVLSIYGVARILTLASGFLSVRDKWTIEQT
jgi:hypothetical protein